MNRLLLSAAVGWYSEIAEGIDFLLPDRTQQPSCVPDHVPLIIGIEEWTPPEDNFRLGIKEGGDMTMKRVGVRLQLPSGAASPTACHVKTKERRSFTAYVAVAGATG